jgi:hypothetical protein
MNMFGWNQSKLARIAELEKQNQELRLARDELLADNKFLEETCDELRSENKSLYNVGMSYRDSAVELGDERDHLKEQLEYRTKQFKSTENYTANLEHAITEAYEAIQKRDCVIKALDMIDRLDSK